MGVRLRLRQAQADAGDIVLWIGAGQ